MDEEREKTEETKTDFSYLARLARAYAEEEKARKRVRMSEEKRSYLIEMQRGLLSIARRFSEYFERAEKKELAAILCKNAGDALADLGAAAEETPIKEGTPLRDEAILLANRSLNMLEGGAVNADLFRYILSEISALYALTVID